MKEEYIKEQKAEEKLLQRKADKAKKEYLKGR